MELVCADGVTGIYCIENTVNGKKYVGQAKDIKSRWNCHLQALRNGKHYNAYLQHSWDKYGEDAFTFSVLEICDISALSDREQYYIAILGTFENGYNLTTGGEGTRGYTHTEEYKIHMSELYKGRTFSEETRQKMSAAKKGKPSNRTVTEAVIEGYKKVSRRRKGEKFTDEHRANLSKAKRECVKNGWMPWNKGMTFDDKTKHPMYGKHHSEEAKKKIGDANRGRPASLAVINAASKKVRCVETGRIYNSLTSAAKEHGVSLSLISRVVRGAGNNKTAAGFHWEYVN